MSYGTWTKRGKGWASLEIDSPWNGITLEELQYRSPHSHGRLKSALGALNIYPDRYEEDVVALRFTVRHRKNKRQVTSFIFDGDETWIAYENMEALESALKRLELSKAETATVLKDAQSDWDKLLPSEKFGYQMYSTNLALGSRLGNTIGIGAERDWTSIKPKDKIKAINYLKSIESKP